MSRITEAEARKRFKDHLVTISKPESHLGPVTVINWQNTDRSSVDHIRYFINGGTLMSCGDLGDAVYQWSRDMGLRSLAACNLDYFTEKCQASQYGVGGMEWDEDEAREGLQHRIDEALRGTERTVSAFDLIAAYSSEYPRDVLADPVQWSIFLSEHTDPDQCIIIPGTKDLDEDGRGIGLGLEESYDIGNIPGKRIQWHLWGLKLAHEQCERRLSAEEMQNL